MVKLKIKTNPFELAAGQSLGESGAEASRIKLKEIKDKSLKTPDFVKDAGFDSKDFLSDSSPQKRPKKKLIADSKEAHSFKVKDFLSNQDINESNIVKLAKKGQQRKETFDEDFRYLEDQFRKLGKDPERLKLLDKGDLYTLIEVFELMDGSIDKIFPFY